MELTPDTIRARKRLDAIFGILAGMLVILGVSAAILGIRWLGVLAIGAWIITSIVRLNLWRIFMEAVAVELIKREMASRGAVR